MRPSLMTFLRAAALGAAIACAVPAAAGPFTNLFVFGDSIVDTGNISLATGGVVPLSPPYAPGRFSDGPVWVETLATGLGLPLAAAPALAGGNNYAFGGARTGTGSSPPGVLSQVAGLYGPTHPIADPDALYVISAGSNDMRDARSAFSGNTLADEAGRQAAALLAVDNLASALTFLAGSGARHVLLPNLADLGRTPEAAALGLVFASTDASNRFNSLLLQLEMFAESMLMMDVTILDIAGYQSAVNADALGNGGALYGITNVLLPCGSFPGSVGISCSVTLYADGLHPSVVAHRQIGELALVALRVTGGPGTQVPAPPTIWLLGLAALALLRVGRVRTVAAP